MNESLTEVETGEITTATRSVEVNNVKVKEGEVIVLHNGNLIGAANNLLDACNKFLEAAKANEKERITFFYGINITPEKVDSIVEVIKKTYLQHEIEVKDGGQPYYQFIISVE